MTYSSNLTFVSAFRSRTLPAKIDTFSSKMDELKAQRQTNLQAPKPKTVILGAGPGGLIRGIAALVNGNPLRIIEKRNPDQAGRLNPIILTTATVKILKDYGIYQYLQENGRLGTTPNDDRFPVSVSINDLEDAMKKIIAQLCPDAEIILYGSELDHVVEKTGAAADLYLKAPKGAVGVLRNIDRVIVVEGSKSKTLTDILHGRRIQVLHPFHALGGIFEDHSNPLKQSFTYNLDTAATGMVIYTPGKCSVGIVPLWQQSIEETSEGRTITRLKQEKTELENLDPWVQSVFENPQAKGQPLPALDQKLFSAATTLSSDFAVPFCGKLGDKTLFFLAGDSLFQVDATTGMGANNAIETLPTIIPSLSENNAEALMEAYWETMIEKIDESMGKVACARGVLDIPYSTEGKKQALTLLKNRGVVEKTDYVGCLKNVYSCAVNKIQSASNAIRTSRINDYIGRADDAITTFTSNALEFISHPFTPSSPVA